MNFQFKIQPLKGIPNQVCKGDQFIVEIKGRSWGEPGRGLGYPTVGISFNNRMGGFGVNCTSGGSGWRLNSLRGTQDTGWLRCLFTAPTAAWSNTQFGVGLSTGNWVDWKYRLIK